MAEIQTSNFSLIVSLILVIVILGFFVCYFARPRNAPVTPSEIQDNQTIEISPPEDNTRSLISLVASSSVMMFSVPIAFLRNFEVGDLSIRFLSPGNLKTNIPIKSTQDRLYFEILLLDLPLDCCFFVGLTPAASNGSQETLNCTVSIEVPSGKVRILGIPVECLSEARFTSGDVIGCLVTTTPTCEINFSKNGVMGQPIPFSVYGTLLHPTIYSTGPCHIQYNFGQSEYLYNPFSRRSFYFDPPTVACALGEPPVYAKDSVANPNTSSSQNNN
ncbi:Protein ssh4 [Entomophthora muscae]|uniref:Protein ssh4 n=1 Tax=Entomophthora muscae TaxID=34485 RepID=A0ACC2T9Q9_9FUNG|nr:Protein ssh4 [Entomophthora muscae]